MDVAEALKICAEMQESTHAFAEETYARMHDFKTLLEAHVYGMKDACARMSEALGQAQGDPVEPDR